VTVQVRLAEPPDVEAIVAFGSAVVPPHYIPILGAEAAQSQLTWWTAERFEPAVAAGRVHVAIADGAVVGVCETGERAGDQVIWKLYVAPAFRGRAVGTELLRAAIVTLPPGLDHLLVEHFAGNTRAGAFYERKGFVVIGTEPARSGDPRAAVVWRRLELGGRS
jgi:ribosomal protein S18 acetylase RimI-like enzyme